MLGKATSRSGIYVGSKRIRIPFKKIYSVRQGRLRAFMDGFNRLVYLPMQRLLVVASTMFRGNLFKKLKGFVALLCLVGAQMSLCLSVLLFHFIYVHL